MWKKQLTIPNMFPFENRNVCPRIHHERADRTGHFYVRSHEISHVYIYGVDSPNHSDPGFGPAEGARSSPTLVLVQWQHSLASGHPASADHFPYYN